MIFKTQKQQLMEARQRVRELEAALSREREKVQFLALLTADIDIDEMTDEEEAGENDE